MSGDMSEKEMREYFIDSWLKQPCTSCHGNKGNCCDMHVSVPDDAVLTRCLFADVLKPCDADQTSECFFIVRSTRTPIASPQPCYSPVNKKT